LILFPFNSLIFVDHGAEADGNGICNARVEYSGNGNVFANLSFDSMAVVIVGWQLPKRCSED
jgi:hypothetical protein